MPQEKTRFAVLGAGRIGKIHAENLVRRIPRAEVVALSDTSPDKLASMEAKYEIPDTFSDYREVLRLPNVDAVAVCTPTNTHYQIILDAAAAGKHIFCEKPVDLSVENTEKIIEAVQKCGVKLMVGFNRRFDPNFLKIKEMVRAGKVGEIHVIKITSRDPSPPSEDYIRSSGGLFLDMTIHDFDMARHLMGCDVTEVYAMSNALIEPACERAGECDTAVVMLKFENGAMAAIDNSRKAVYGYDQRAEVFGSEGMVAVENDTLDRHVCLDRTGAHASLPLNYFMDRYTESYLNEMQAFVDSVLRDKPVPVTGRDGLMAVVIALAAAKSAREHRPVSLGKIA